MRPRFRATCNNNQSTSRSLIRAIWSPFRASFHTLDFAETMGPSAMLPSSAFSSGFDLRLQGLYLRVSGSGRPSGPALLRRNNQSFRIISSGCFADALFLLDSTHASPESTSCPQQTAHPRSRIPCIKIESSPYGLDSPTA